VTASREIVNYTITISHPLLTQQKCFELFGKGDAKFTLLELSRLFLAFSKSDGNEEYNYLWHFFRIAYLLAMADGFLFDVMDLEDGYISIAKPLLSPLSVQKQLQELQKITPQILTVEGKKVTANVANEILLSIFLSEAVRALEFPMKKGRGDRIFEAIFDLLFRGEKIEKNFEIDDAIKSLDRYFGIFDILKSEIAFSIVIEQNGNEYSMQFFANGLHIHKLTGSQKIAAFKLIVKFASTLPEIEILAKQESVSLEFGRLEKFLLEQKETILDLGIGVVIPKELQRLLKRFSKGGDLNYMKAHNVYHLFLYDLP